MRIYRDEDIDRSLLDGTKVAVIGYGNQGHAHALNLRDSGVAVIVGARQDGASWDKAQADGFEPMRIGDAAQAADWIMLSLADEVIPSVFDKHVAPHLKSGKTLAFAHGLVLHFNCITIMPDIDVFLVAPKGAGRWLRHRYEAGSGLAALAAVHHDASGQAFQKALAYAGAIGCGRAGILQTSCKEECVTDLFGEQAVLCGGIPGLLKSGYDLLVEAGYAPELAYFECIQEAKLIVDLIAEQGMQAMRSAISNTAEYGGYGAETRMMDGRMKQQMRAVLDDIESGRFANTFMANGADRLRAERRAHQDNAMEQAGAFVRKISADQM